jgi:hypothetical protein
VLVRYVALAIRSRITDKTGNNPQRESQAGRGVLGSLRNQAITVRREKALDHSGMKGPPGNWIAPPGSNRSGGGGNKAAGASGVEGRIRRLGESAGCNVSER